MNADEIRKMDEAATDVSQHFVPLLFGFFATCKAAGFSEEQSFDLAKTYMILLMGKPKGPVDV